MEWNGGSKWNALDTHSKQWLESACKADPVQRNTKGQEVLLEGNPSLDQEPHAVPSPRSELHAHRRGTTARPQGYKQASSAPTARCGQTRCEHVS